MKSERRHELQHNDLADWLVKQAEEFQPHAKVVTGVAIGVVALMLAWMLWSRQSESRRGAGWTEYYAASNERNVDDLWKVYQDHTNAPVGVWAALAAADLQLENGGTRIFRDRPAAEKELKGAIEKFNAVLEHVKTVRPTGAEMANRRAQFGLAQAYEALLDPESAEKHYRQLAETSPDSALGKAAQAQLKRLQDERTREFYAWFAQQDLSTRQSHPGGSIPGHQIKPRQPYDDLPSAPDLSLPDSADLKKSLGSAGETGGLFAPGTAPGSTDLTFPGAAPDFSLPVPDAPKSPVTPAPDSTAPDSIAPDSKTPETATPPKTPESEAAPPKANEPPPVDPAPKVPEPNEKQPESPAGSPNP